MRVALVMGSGGTSGSLWMRTILAELESEIGFRTSHAQTIIGTSAGAVVGAEAEPHGPTDSQVVAGLSLIAGELPAVPQNMAAYYFRRLVGRLVGIAAITGKHDSREWVHHRPRHMGLRTIATTALGSRRVGTPQGPHALDEIAASVAIPFWNMPIKINGDRLSDGAVWSATNVDLIDPDEFDLLVLFTPHVTLESKTLSFTGLHRAQVARELRDWRASGKPCLWMLPSLESYERRDDREAVVRDAISLVAAKLG
jgi:predicted acylesterase/phospholipase RssA